MDFADRPALVFWETTKACTLSCIHCRASAIDEPLPSELTREEGFRLVDQVASFGRPFPTIILTGGDPLRRRDLFDLLTYAARREMKFAVSPAATNLLSREVLVRIKQLGASSVSISLDGAWASTHDAIRRREGTYERTVRAVQDAVEIGLDVQVNTVVMKRNFRELAGVFSLVRGLGVRTWELFFLVKVGRGSGAEDIAPAEYESACNFLYDASFYGQTIRCVEATFIRRVLRQRSQPGTYWRDDDYLRLKSELVEREGEQSSDASTLRQRGTLDGDGVVFVAYDGTIHPGGLLPLSIGNVRRDTLSEVYRGSEVLRRIRAREMSGPCGECEFRDVCGGSRARAYAYTADPLASDPACVYASRNLEGTLKAASASSLPATRLSP